MNKVVSSILKWGVGFITAILAAVIADRIVGINIMGYISDVINSIWKYIIKFMNIGIPIWIILLLAFLYVILILLEKNRVTNDEILKNDWKKGLIEYREGEINGSYYKWDWRFIGNKYMLENLTRRCPYDKTVINYDNVCPMCGKSYGYGEDINSVVSIILRKAELIIENCNNGMEN